MTLLSQHIDTFKEALYLNADATEYNKTINYLKSLKEQAQSIKDIDNDNRFVSVTLDNRVFKVMATSIRGYSVVIKNGDVSIALKTKKDINDKNPSIKIEYRSSFLVNYGLRGAIETTNEFIKKAFHNDYISKVQEIHIASDIQGHSFSLLDMVRFKTRARKVKAIEGDDGDIGRNLFLSSRRLETLYFGSSNNMLRIYDKTKEISKNPTSAHIERLWRLNSDYNDRIDVWRIEFQIRREVLKNIYSDNNIELEYTYNLLENMGSLWSYLTTYFQYKSFSRDESLSIIEGYRTLKSGKEKLLTKEAVRKMYQRANNHDVWNLLKDFNATQPKHYFRFQKQKATSPVYVMNSINSVVSTMIKHFGRFDYNLLKECVELSEIRSYKNYEISLIEKQIQKADDYFNKIVYQKKIGLECIDLHDSVKQNFIEFSSEILSHINPKEKGAICQYG